MIPALTTPMTTTQLQASMAPRFSCSRAATSSSSFWSSGGGRRMRSTMRCAAAAAAAVAPVASGNMYEVLGLRAGATGREIKAAYRRLALERHPDVVAAGADDGNGDFIRLHDAYATLSDPDARARYDLAQAFARPPAARPPPTYCSGGAARPRRTWETDQCW